MRLLKDLLNDNSIVWIYCRDEAYQMLFLTQAENEGFKAINGQKPTELFHHQLYGISDDMTVGYLSAMIWHLTFHTGTDDHVRVDYANYMSGAEDYICHTVNLKRVDYGSWNMLAYSNGLKHKQFEKMCDSFIEEQSFEEYNAFVYRYLIESSWHYTPEQAVERMQNEDYYIVKCYINKIPVANCAVEVGYGCG